MNWGAITALAAVWLCISGKWGVWDVLLGAVVGAISLGMAGQLWRKSSWTLRPGSAARAAAVFMVELVRNTVEVAWHVVRPRLAFRPGVRAIPLMSLSDRQITTLANLLTLTPGTVALGVSRDRTRLFVHVFDASDFDTTCRRARALERHVIDALR